ncbi:MAG: hypothetical protein GY702_10230 [Desulfobulbaceae bacterium]|nr:hypothetical protein [Desulfobulbaceae bacterium]
MRSAESIIANAHFQGIEICIVEGALKCVSDTPLPVQIIDAIRSNKSAIIEVLKPQVKAPAIDHTWIEKNLSLLLAAGFIHKDIYGDRWITGVTYLTLWGKTDLSVRLEDDVIIFNWKNSNGKTITQTCRPEAKA